MDWPVTGEGEMFHTIYKTTNTVNGKIYIGAHSTMDPHDRYLGSGAELRKDIELLGYKVFIKEILHVFDTEEEMKKKERELVTPEFCLREDVYNKNRGGGIGGHRKKWPGVTKVVRLPRMSEDQWAQMELQASLRSQSVGDLLTRLFKEWLKTNPPNDQYDHVSEMLVPSGADVAPTNVTTPQPPPVAESSKGRVRTWVTPDFTKQGSGGWMWLDQETGRFYRTEKGGR